MNLERGDFFLLFLAFNCKSFYNSILLKQFRFIMCMDSIIYNNCSSNLDLQPLLTYKMNFKKYI